jgi:hypothetical protein
LVDSVRGPQQAQQAWELVALLASRPLPAHTAHVVAHTAVQLVNVRAMDRLVWLLGVCVCVCRKVAVSGIRVRCLAQHVVTPLARMQLPGAV